MQQYVIQPNDTLFLLAKKFKIPLVQLINANPQIKNPNMLYIGQIIQIPDLLPVPEQLDKIDSLAKEIMDNVYLNDWSIARDNLKLLIVNFNEVLPILQQVWVPDQLINKMKQAIIYLDENIKQKDVKLSIIQANRITNYVTEMLDYFNVLVPTEVKKLGNIARQIIINVENNDWISAKNNYLRAVKIWDKLKLEINEKYAADIVEFDRILNSLGEAVNSKNYQMAIENALTMDDKVDILELNFREQNTEM
ncbi:LysM peptidoglycan-binding domain-containing protein [Anaerovorax odorimutans]|uniref:LysM peptidoglycan-binding domain-containing protein n=1 Tax=Anaerovorax odorimutans TaxID=109327 RepID=UPI0004021F77|nr:LysM peptidoglycan-binding domain-containing protein [Anaerovorax odorimutans]